MLWGFRIILLLLAIIIAGQDFRSRLIHLLLLILFLLINCAYYLTFNSYSQLLTNFLFCAGYFLFNFLIIKLYYILKGNSNEKIMDHKIGWGDIAIFLSVGVCMEPVIMIWFFTISFLLSVLLFYSFIRKNTVPLAGFIVLFYLVYIVYITAGGSLDWLSIN
jgi:hypothetical protein